MSISSAHHEPRSLTRASRLPFSSTGVHSGAGGGHGPPPWVVVPRPPRGAREPPHRGAAAARRVTLLLRGVCVAGIPLFRNVLIPLSPPPSLLLPQEQFRSLNHAERALWIAQRAAEAAKAGPRGKTKGSTHSARAPRRADAPPCATLARGGTLNGAAEPSPADAAAALAVVAAAAAAAGSDDEQPEGDGDDGAPMRMTWVPGGGEQARKAAARRGPPPPVSRDFFGLDESIVGDVLMIWDFCNVYGRAHRPRAACARPGASWSVAIGPS